MQPKKLIIINILDILKKYTDENHRLSQKDIADILEKEYGMKVDRKAVKRNLMNLIEFGYDIEYSETARTVKNKNGNMEENVILSDFYFVRDFTDAELRLLIDSLLFSKHIPYSQCKELIKKIENLSNKHFHSKVRHIHNLPENMPRNKELFYTIEVIDEAITNGKQIAFRYNYYRTDKKQYPRLNNEGKARDYVVNPYQMVATNGRYYLVCNYDKHDNVANYRIDRITDIRLLDTPIKPINKVYGLENGLDLPKHMAEHIYMFADKTQRVTFRAKKYIVTEIVDWFGKDVKFYDETDDEVTAEVRVSPMAMKFWAMQYAGPVTVLSPDSLVEEIAESLRTAASRYAKAVEKNKWNYFDVLEDWEELLRNVKYYFTGKKTFDTKLFSKAMKGAHDIFSKIDIMQSISVHGSQKEMGMHDILELSRLMSEYMANRFIDESESKVFTASQLAVRMMIQMLSYDFTWQNKGILDAHTTGIFLDGEGKYIYNINDGSLSDMIELVKIIDTYEAL